MDLLGEVEENLRALSVEARKSKQLSGVKEAAERGTLKCRSLKEGYAGYLRQKRKQEEESGESGAKGASTGDQWTGFQCPDLLQPFLLACNYTDAGARLTLLSLSGIQHLMTRDAMHPDDGLNVMRVLAIQAHSASSEVQLRVLQSSLLLVSSLQSSAMSEELLSQALLVCFALTHGAKDGAVRHAALATVRQTLSMLFDRVATVAAQASSQHSAAQEALAVATKAYDQERKSHKSGEGVSSSSAAETGAEQDEGLKLKAAVDEEKACAAAVESAGLSGVGRCAYLVFQDLCVLSRGEQGVWLKRTSVAPATGLELVESILSQQPRLFLHDPMFATLVSRQVCPLLLQLLRGHADFPLLVRAMRAVATLLRDFGKQLVDQAEPLLAALLHTLAAVSAHDHQGSLDPPSSYDASPGASAGGGGSHQGPSSLSLSSSSGSGSSGMFLAERASNVSGIMRGGLGLGGSGGMSGTGIGGGGSGGYDGGVGSTAAERAWAALLALEAILALCQDPHLLFALFAHYDLAQDPPEEESEDDGKDGHAATGLHGGEEDDGVPDAPDSSFKHTSSPLIASPVKRRPSAESRAAIAGSSQVPPPSSTNTNGDKPPQRRPVALIGNVVTVVAHFLAMGTSTESGVNSLLHGLKRLAATQPSPSTTAAAPVSSGHNNNGLLVGFGGTPLVPLSTPSTTASAAATTASSTPGAPSVDGVPPATPSIESQGSNSSSGTSGSGDAAGPPPMSPSSMGVSKHHLRARQATFAGSHSVRDLLLEHTAPLPVPDSEALALALNCLVALSESLRALLLQAYGAPLPSKTSSSSQSNKRAGSSSSSPSSSPSSPSSSHASPGSASGGLLFVPPPPSLLVFRSPSEQSLADFLADSEQSTNEEGGRGAGKASVDGNEDTADAPASQSAHVVSPAQQRQREAVRSFVEAVWENVLSAASQLLIHSHAAAANHRTTTASASSSNNSATSGGSANSGSGANNSSSSGSSHSNGTNVGSNHNGALAGSSSSASTNGKGSSSSGAAVQRRLLDKLLTVYVSFTISAGLGGLQTPRDCFLGSLCKAALPSPWLHSSSSSSSSAVSKGYAQDYGGSPQALSPPHVAVLKAVLTVSHTLANSLGSSWAVVMDTLDQLDAALRRRVTATMNARPSAASAIAGGLASNSSSALTKSKSTDNASGSNTTKMDSGGVIGLDLSAMGLTPHEVRLASSLERFVRFTSCLESKALIEVVEALSALSRTSLGLYNSRPNARAISSQSHFMQKQQRRQQQQQRPSPPSVASPHPPFTPTSSVQGPTSSSTAGRMQSVNNGAYEEGSGGGWGLRLGNLLTGVSDRVGFRSLAGYAAPNEKLSDMVENANSSSQSFYQGANVSSSSSSYSSSQSSGLPRAPAYAQTVPPSSSSSVASSSNDSTGASGDIVAPAAETTSPPLAAASAPNPSGASSSSTSMKQMPRAAVPPLEAVPFALRALVQVAVANHSRLSTVWPQVCSLLELVATQARAPPLRAFAVDAHRAMAHHLLNLHAQLKQSQDNDDDIDEGGLKLAHEGAGGDSTTATAGARASPDQSDLDGTDTKQQSSSRHLSLSRGGGQLSVGWLVASGLDGVLFEDLFAPPPTPTSAHVKQLQRDEEVAPASVPLESLLEPLRALADRTNQVDVREQVLLAANGLLTSCGTKLHPNLWQSLFDLLAAAAHGKSCVKSTSSSSGSGADSASEDLSKVDVASTSAATSNAETSPPLTSSETAELSTLVSKGGSLTPLETHRVRHLMAKSTPGSRDPNALPTGVESTKGSGVGGGGFKSAEEEMEWLMEKAKGAGTLSANEQARMRALMLHATGKEGAPGAAPSIHMGGQASSSSSSSSWSGACVALAFRSLKLIVDDFLEVVPSHQLACLVTCAASFAAQKADMNVSLTAVGMLWAVVDFVEKHKEDGDKVLTKSDEVGGEDGDKEKKEKGVSGSSVTGTSSSSSESSSSSSGGIGNAWHAMLIELGTLALDTRPEVRNCAVNTLVSAVGANGAKMSAQQWRSALAEVVLPLVQQVEHQTQAAASGGAAAAVHEVRPGVLLTAHHSRDTAAKQWSETRDLALQGLNRLLRTAATSHAAPSFLATASATSSASQAANTSTAATTSTAAAAASGDGLLTPAPWFGEVWSGSLQLAVGASLQGSNEQEAALAGIGLLVGMCKLSGQAWMPQDPIKYSNVMRVVDGALVRVDTTTKAKDRKKVDSSSSSSSSTSDSSPSSETGAAAAGSHNKEGWIGGPRAWNQAWAALQSGCSFEVDDEGEVANKALEGLTQLFDQCKDCEFASSPHRLVELVQLVGSLLWPRYAHPSSYGPRGRAPFRFPVCKAQKVGLALLETIALHLHRHAKSTNHVQASSSLSSSPKLTGLQAKKAQAAGPDMQLLSSCQGRYDEDGHEEQVWVALVGVLSGCAAPAHGVAAALGASGASGSESSAHRNRLHAKFSALAADALSALFHASKLSEMPPSSPSSSPDSSNSSVSQLPNQQRLSYIPSAIASNSQEETTTTPESMIAASVATASDDAAKVISDAKGKDSKDEKEDCRMPSWAAASAFATATRALAPSLPQPPLPPPGLQATSVQTRSLQAKAPLKHTFLKPFLAAEVAVAQSAAGSAGNKGKASLTSTSCTCWSLRPPLLRSPEAATRWLSALLMENRHSSSLLPSFSSSSQGATATTMRFQLCESGQSMAGLPLAARLLVAIAKPSLCAVALREEEQTREAGSDALSGNSSTKNMTTSSMSPAVAAALRKTRGALWQSEVCEPSASGDDEGLVPCQQIDADAAAEVSRAEDPHPPDLPSSLSSPPSSPERRRKGPQGSNSKNDEAVSDCADIPVNIRTVGSSTVVDTVRVQLCTVAPHSQLETSWMQLLTSSIHLLVPYCIATPGNDAAAAAAAVQQAPHLAVPVDLTGGARAASMPSRNQILEHCCDTILIVSPQLSHASTVAGSTATNNSNSNKMLQRYVASPSIRALQGDLLGHACLCLATAHRLLLAAAPSSANTAADSGSSGVDDRDTNDDELSLVVGCVSSLVATARGQDPSVALSRVRSNRQGGGGEEDDEGDSGNTRSQTRTHPTSMAAQQVLPGDAPPQWVSERALKHVTAFARQQLLLYLATANLFTNANGHGSAGASKDVSGSVGGGGAREGAKAETSESNLPLRGRSCEAAEALAMVALNALSQLLSPSPSGEVAGAISTELSLAARVAVTTLLPLLTACAAGDLPTADGKEGEQPSAPHNSSSDGRLRRTVASIVRACESAATITELQQRANDAEERAAAAEAALAASKGLSHAAAYQEGYATGFAF